MGRLRQLIKPGKLDAGVIALQYLGIIPALFSQTVSAYLAHANAMTPAATGEDEARYPPSRIILAINDKSCSRRPSTERIRPPRTCAVPCVPITSRSIARLEEPRAATRKSVISQCPEPHARDELEYE